MKLKKSRKHIPVKIYFYLELQYSTVIHIKWINTRPIIKSRDREHLYVDNGGSVHEQYAKNYYEKGRVHQPTSSRKF